MMDSSGADPLARSEGSRSMSRKWRKVLIVAVVVLIGAELSLRFLLRTRATVEIVNNGTAPMEDLKVSCEGVETAVPSIAPGKRGIVYMKPPAGGRPSKLKFKQAKSVFSFVQIDDFDPPKLERDREKFVVEMSNDGYRFLSEETGEAEANLAERAFANVKSFLESVP